jgi:hypothetical protein
MLRRHFRVLGMLCAALLSCTSRPPTPEHATVQRSLFRALSTSVDSGLVLAAFALQDTVKLGQPVWIAYWIANSGRRREFRNDPTFFRFEVTGPSGRLLGRSPRSYDPGSTGTAPNIVLPARGAIGQAINLSCAAPNYALRAGADTVCDWSFTFDQAGRYTVTVRYMPILPPDPVDKGDRRFNQVTSNEFSIVLTP